MELIFWSVAVELDSMKLLKIMKQSQKKDMQIKVIERQVYNLGKIKNDSRPISDPTVTITTTVTLLTGA